MSGLTAAALKLMADKGLSAHDIAELAALIEKPRDPTGAERQARHREKKREERNGVTVTRDVTSVTPSPLRPPLKTPPDPQKITPPITPQPVDMSAEPTPLTPDEIVEAWNERMAPQGFPPVRKLTGSRQRQLRARIKENSLEEWLQAMTALERSAFCRGENDRGWRADFDFLLQPKSFTKLLEGAYDH